MTVFPSVEVDAAIQVRRRGVMRERMSPVRARVEKTRAPILPGRR